MENIGTRVDIVRKKKKISTDPNARNMDTKLKNVTAIKNSCTVARRVTKIRCSVRNKNMANKNESKK